jgi:hypothetical protein
LPPPRTRNQKQQPINFSFFSNFTMTDDGGWGELFALAEGKVPEPVEERKSNNAPAQKRKRQQQEQYHQLFDDYLHDRTKNSCVDIWPDWTTLKGSIIKPACHGWRKGEEDSRESTCHTCGDSRLHHLLACTTKRWPLELFCCVRNLRTAAKLLLTSTEELNISAIQNECKRFEKVCIKLKSPDYQLLEIKCGEAQLLVQRLWRSGDCSRSTKVDDAIRIIVACDSVYYQLYYLSITGKLLGSCIPHPLQYFGQPNLTMALSDATNCMKEFTGQLRKSLPSKELQELMSRYGIDNDPESEHPLSALHHYRWLETVTLFHGSGWMSSDRVREETWRRVKTVQEEHETPGPTLLSEWRDSSRDFLCHLYAYATVPNSSLDRIQQLLSQHNVRNGIVELGAGTGYLAHLLRKKGVRVEAYDICPTSTSNDGMSHNGNEYHGGTPSFVRVEKGNIGILSSITGLDHRALLLCYPPPKSSMAYDALLRFLEHGGNVFIHVGEFKGLTGSTDFERCLQKRFKCVERFPCLTWGTDTSEMTVWTKKGPDTPKSLFLPCSNCREVEATKRCRLQRYLQYCSKECFDDHDSLRREHLRMSMIDDAKGRLSFNNKDHFSSLK